MVVEVAVVDDGGIELVLVAHDALVCVLGDHRGVFAGLGVDIIVEIANDERPLLLGLLVEVGHGDTGGEDGIIGVGDGHVGGSLGSLEESVSARDLYW